MSKKPVEGGLNWEVIGQDGFEKTVEALLTRVHSDAERAWSPNDSGGDGGRDFQATYGDGRHYIYQMKFFPDGLTSKPDSRKTQLKRSFTSAKKHGPTDWVLVFPGKLNDTMGRFVRDLAKGTAIKISIIDAPKLDSMLAPHSDLVNLLKKDDYLLEQAKVFNQEKAVLDGGMDDFADRESALYRLVNDQDPYWGVNFSRSRGTLMLQPYAKSPHSAAQSPLEYSLSVEIPVDDQEMSVRARAFFGFGEKGSLKVPGAYVKQTGYRGPDFLRLPDEITALILGSTDGMSNIQGKSIRLSFKSEEGVIEADHAGKITYGMPGSEGHTVEAVFYNTLRLTLRSAYTEGEEGQLTYSLDCSDADPRSVQLGCHLALAFRTGSVVDFWLAGMHVGVIGLQLDRDADENEEAKYVHALNALAEMADDVEFVQRHFKQHFDMPTDLTDSERVWLRAVRIMLAGKVAALPVLEISGHAHKGLALSEPELQGEVRQFLVTVASATMCLAGRELPLPAYVVYHPRVEMTGLSESAEDADAGAQDQRSFTGTAQDKQTFVGFLATTNAPRVHEPWNLTGIAEPMVPEKF